VKIKLQFLPDYVFNITFSRFINQGYRTHRQEILDVGLMLEKPASIAKIKNDDKTILVTLSFYHSEIIVNTQRQ